MYLYFETRNLKNLLNEIIIQSAEHEQFEKLDTISLLIKLLIGEKYLSVTDCA